MKYLSKRCLSILFFLFLPSVTLATKPIHFAVIGDFGSNSLGEKKVAKLIDKENPEFILTVGDNNYPNGCWKTIDKNIGKYYSKFIGNYQGGYGKGATQNRFFPTLGNHDWNARATCLYHGNLPYLEYFTLPGNGRYYDFVKGPVHFFAIDADEKEPDGTSIGSKQYLWLKEKLSKSSATFKVVYFHHAPYSSSYHGSDNRMQWDFDKLGVDVVFAGHDHTYERLEKDGVVYYVNGLGGSDVNYLIKKMSKYSKRIYLLKYGYMTIKADENQMLIKFVNESNHVKDTKVVYAKNNFVRLFKQYFQGIARDLATA